MLFESISRSSVEGDWSDRLLELPGEAADVEKGQQRRRKADSIGSTYNTVQLWAKRRWQNTPSFKLVHITYTLIVIATLFALLLLIPSRNGLQRDAGKPSGVAKWSKPEGFKIIGLVFFGRRATVEILDCYLKKNLVSNGGYLDEIQFVAVKATKEDVAWLDQLLLSADEYQKVVMKDMSYEKVWNNTVERNHMYIKIDDDLVYLSDDAIPQLIYSKLKHPEALDIAANLINAAELGWMHYHLGAIHSYLPETEPPFSKILNDQSYGSSAWRASALPTWNATGKENATLDFDGPPPYKGHRWLPLRQNDTNLSKTPISRSAYEIFSPNWKSWAIGAQSHYSFLQNLERNQLERFHFGADVDGDGREAIWNMAFGRMNINLLAIWGNDVRDNAPFGKPDDEEFLSVDLPRRLNRPLLINTYALAVHFSFFPQKGIYDTDLLSRYRAYANERVCTANNQVRIETDPES